MSTTDPLPSASRVVAQCRPLVIAHRGFSSQAPENTLPAFRAALELHVDLVEFDFAVSADGQPLVFHDERLDRTTDAAQRWAAGVPLASRTAADLATLDAGSWFGPLFAGTRIPPLTAALELIAPRAVALAERKAGRAADVVRWLSEAALGDWVVLGAFDWPFLAECRSLAPQLVLAALGEGRLTAAQADRAGASGAAVVGWNERDVDPAAVRLVHQRGRKLWAWTVDEPGRMRELLGWGVDGIITNRPDRLQAVLGPACAST